MVEKRWVFAVFFLLQIKKSKKMKVNEKLVLTEIKGTPFTFATDGKKKYIICGKVLLETEKDESQVKEYVLEKPYELIALIAQATAYEIIMSNQKNQQK